MPIYKNRNTNVSFRNTLLSDHIVFLIVIVYSSAPCKLLYVKRRVNKMKRVGIIRCKPLKPMSMEKLVLAFIIGFVIGVLGGVMSGWL